MPTPILEMELIPKTSWFSNLRTNLTDDQWNKIRTDAYKKYRYHCCICGQQGAKHPVEAHEKWSYHITDDGRYIQRLDDVLALCPACHQVKHSGLAIVNGHREQITETLATVNYWDYETVEAYLDEQFELWNERSQHFWELDTSWLETHYGIVMEIAPPENPVEHKPYIPSPAVFKEVVHEYPDPPVVEGIKIKKISVVDALKHLFCK